MVIIEHIGDTASLIGSVSVIAGAILWLFNLFVLKPKERRRKAAEEKRERQRKEDEEERYKKMLEVASAQDQPLVASIEVLNGWLKESSEDRAELNRIVRTQSNILEELKKSHDNHETRLDSHHDRILVLEVIGGKKQVRTLEDIKDEEF